MAEAEEMALAFQEFKIEADTTRSKAQRNKKNREKEEDEDAPNKQEPLCFCAVCSYAFEGREELKEHLNVHRADRNKIKGEFQRIKSTYDAQTAGRAAQYNYKLALARVTMLENYRVRLR
jgi:hypothetical protein